MLVCVPLSTMPAWQKEFSQWAPDMNTVAYIGDTKSRDIIRRFECENDEGELNFNVLLTSYEMVSKDSAFFQDIVWSNIVVDEAHRLKNDQSLLYKVKKIAPQLFVTTSGRCCSAWTPTTASSSLAPPSRTASRSSGASSSISR